MSARSTGWEVMATENGDVLQSGVYTRPENHYQDLNTVMGWVTRAVVLQVYFPEEDDRNAWTEGKQRCLTCDVRTYGRFQRNLFRVPVLQRTHALWDEDLYVPRPSRLDLDGGSIISQPSGDEQPTPADRLDGDHVLIGFLDNDPQQPVVLPFSMAHPSAQYVPSAADGHTRRIRHNGVALAWDSDGNVTLDATEAARELLGDKGSEESNSGTGGKITLITSDGTNKTSIQLNEKGQILLGSDPQSPSDEPIVLGSQWISIMGELIDAILALTVGTGVGPSSVPVNAAQFSAIKAKIDAKLHVSDFIFAKKAH